MEMQGNNHKEHITLAVTDLGKEDIFLGHEWLQYHNPLIDWKQKHLYFDCCPRHCRARLYDNDVEPEDEPEPEPIDDGEIIEEGERLLIIDISQALDVCAHYTPSQEMAVKEEKKKKGEKTVEEDLPAYLQDYRDVFDKKEFNELPPSQPWDHAIKLIEGADTTFKCQLYGLSHEERAQLDEFLKENLRTGRIRMSSSPMASPFFFVKKKDGRLCPVQDYRQLNDITKKNHYPPPLISDLINTLQDAKYFTKLDVRWGYNNVHIKEGDERKAAFRTNHGLYEPTVMFFGLTNSPTTFQTMMDEIFQIKINNGQVIVYIDDVLIFSKTLHKHHAQVHRVMQIFRNNKLYLNLNKCTFDEQETEYLGVIVGHGQVHMDPVKIASIADWRTPMDKQQVQSFLGFCNFYRRFIQGYSGITRLLTCLTGNDPWVWGPEQEEAFDQIKTLITTAPILTIPTDDDPFRVEADASEFAIGAVLSQ